MPQTLFDDFGDPGITAGELSHGATSPESERSEYSYRQIPNSQHVVFDIETGPAWVSDSIDDAKAYCEPLGIAFDLEKWLEENPKPEPFDADAVAFRVSKKGGGRLVDPQKIADEVERQRATHKTIDEWENEISSADQSFWENVIDNAALSPVTGKALAIGSCRGGKIEIDSVDEREMIENFWALFCDCRSNSQSITGWNISGFDVPFLLIRSAALGIEIPRGVMEKGKWLSDTFVDCMNLWGRGYNPWKQKNCNASAKDVARFLGCHRPDDEIEGKDFWRYFQGDEQQRALAIRYLQNDVAEEAIIARALGVI